jgi:chorismate--pyruvate lyase
MNSSNARAIASVQWQPAERLGQLVVDPHLRPWLIGKGMLTQRLKGVCGPRFALRMLDHWTGLLNASHKAAMRVHDNAGLFCDVEMLCGEQPWVFSQTVIPDATLCAHPWLAELGDSALDDMLNDLSGVERSSYEYAWLPKSDSMTARALRDAHIKPDGLWARRTRVTLRSAPMLVHELFLPAFGGV